MKKKILIFIVLILLLSQFSLASDGGLKILYPNDKFHKINTDLDFYFHVLNSSDFILNVSYVNCTFHLYEPNQGGHIYADKHPNIYLNEFEIEIDKSNFNKIGTYEFNLWCNSTTEGGYISDRFIVNYSGRENVEIIGFLVLNVLVLVFIFLALMNKYLFDGVFMLFSGLFSIILSIVTRNFMQFGFIIDSSLTGLYIVLGLGCIVYSLVMLMESMEQGI